MHFKNLGVFMLKILIIISINLTVLSSAHSTLQNIECYQKRPEWLVMFETDETQATFTWLWSGDKEDLPLQEGITTGRSLAFLNYQMEDLASFPRTGRLIWDKKQCQFREGGTFSCNGQPKSSTSLLQHFQLNLNQQITETTTGDFKNWVFRLAVTTETTTYFLPIRFFDSQCLKN